MTMLQRRLYSAVLRLHPAAFRAEFGREMALDFEDALRDRGFAPLLGDAILSLARQWAGHVLPVGEVEQPVPSHPFLSGQYFMVDQGRLTAFDLACASALSVLLFLAVGFAANTPNNRITTSLPPVPASHVGGIESPGSSSPTATGNGGRQYAAGGRELPAEAGDGSALFRGRVHLGPPTRTNGWGRRAKGGPEATISLADAVRQFATISVIVWLTSLFLRRSPGIGKKVVLGTLGLLGIAASVAFGSVVVRAPTQAQILHASGPPPSFEVATVKPRDPKVMLMMTPPGSQNIVRSAGTGRALIAVAYNVGTNPSLRVVGGPEWIDDHNKSYVLEGKIPEDLFAQMQKMTGDARHNQACLMLQSLLADRFKLQAHVETREMPVYELIIAKDGPKLPPPNDAKPATPTPDSTEPPRAPEMGGGEQVTKDGLRIRNMTLDGMLTAPWFGLGGRPIVNKTGLTGTYNLTLNWVPELPSQAGPNGVPAVPEGQASIFTALQEQLGLKLVPAKDPMEVVVIDHIELPSEN